MSSICNRFLQHTIQRIPIVLTESSMNHTERLGRVQGMILLSLLTPPPEIQRTSKLDKLTFHAENCKNSSGSGSPTAWARKCNFRGK